MNNQTSYGWENSVGEACRLWFLEFFSSSLATIVRKDTRIFFCVSDVPFGHVSLCISLCSCLYFGGKSILWNMGTEGNAGVGVERNRTEHLQHIFLKWDNYKEGSTGRIFQESNSKISLIWSTLNLIFWRVGVGLPVLYQIWS